MTSLGAEGSGAGQAPPTGGHTVTAGPVERVCNALCALGLLLMVVLVAIEVVTRNFMGFSFQISDELGGYIVVGISFLSLCVCQVRGSFHHVEFLQARLGRRAQAVSRVIFGAICIAMCTMLTWQLARLTWNSWDAEDMAATPLLTPLWLPQLLMPVGLAGLTISLVRTLLADLRAAR